MGGFEGKITVQLAIPRCRDKYSGSDHAMICTDLYLSRPAIDLMIHWLLSWQAIDTGPLERLSLLHMLHLWWKGVGPTAPLDLHIHLIHFDSSRLKA